MPYIGNKEILKMSFKINQGDNIFTENIGPIGPIYTRDGSSVWDELGQRTVVRLIIRLCINTGFQTDHPSRRTITVVRLDRRTTVDNSSGRMIRLSV